MDYMRGGGGVGGYGGHGGPGGYGGGPPMGGGGGYPGMGGGMGMGGGGPPMGMGPMGGGGPPMGFGGPPINFADVSYDTSNNDPHMKASRVFVGNLNSAADRDELLRAFWRFGHIIGCTCFKGYAFIQFSSEDEARAAVGSMKGMQFCGQTIDVKLACEGKGGASAKNVSSGNLSADFYKQAILNNPPPLQAILMLSGGGVKRSRDESNVGGGAPTPLMSSGPLGMGGQMGGGGESGFGPASKRPLFGGGDTRSTYRSDTTPADSLQRYEHSDTLICGNCDSVFRDWLTFREHRKEACDPDSLRKPADEPMVIKCFVCKEEFKHSWTLLQHLSSLHHLTVYIDDSNPDQSNGESTSVKEVTQALKKD